MRVLPAMLTQHSTAQHSTAQRSAAQRSTVPAHLLVDALAGGGGTQCGHMKAQRLSSQFNLRLLALADGGQEQLCQGVLPAKGPSAMGARELSSEPANLKHHKTYSQLFQVAAFTSCCCQLHRGAAPT